MQQESSLGLTWKILNRDELPHNLGWLKPALIESLGTDVFAKLWTCHANVTWACRNCKKKARIEAIGVSCDLHFVNGLIHYGGITDYSCMYLSSLSIPWRTTTGYSSGHSSTSLWSTTPPHHVPAQCKKSKLLNLLQKQSHSIGTERRLLSHCLAITYGSVMKLKLGLTERMWWPNMSVRNLSSSILISKMKPTIHLAVTR